MKAREIRGDLRRIDDQYRVARSGSNKSANAIFRLIQISVRRLLSFPPLPFPRCTAAGLFYQQGAILGGLLVPVLT
jgi:hypothetical protein